MPADNKESRNAFNEKLAACFETYGGATSLPVELKTTVSTAYHVSIPADASDQALADNDVATARSGTHAEERDGVYRPTIRC